jgi:hypothetical protein
MSKTKKSASIRMLNYLKSGYDITTNQARNRFGITNVAARVYDLREEGFPVYTNMKKINGEKVHVYRLGTFPRTARTETQRRAALKSA